MENIIWLRTKLKTRSPLSLKPYAVARGFGGQELVARALYGLARIALLKKDFVAARQQAQESLAIFETERHEKVAEVKQLLAALENSM